MARTSPRRDGCGFLILTAVFTGIFLVINGGLFSGLYGLWRVIGPEIFSQPKVAQFCMFIGPVVLLVLEWWLVDLLVETLTPWLRRANR